MQTDFQKALGFTLTYEGGASSHNADTAARFRLAGERIHTTKGVTQQTYNSFRVRQGAGVKPVRLISDLEVEAIYKQQYWDAAGCNDLHFPANAVLFDLAVNSGVGRARQVLREAESKGFSNKYPQQLAQFICDWRANFFNAIIRSNPSQTVFRRGWFNRLRALKDFINYQK